MKNNTVVLVGCGNMGYAMLQGWLDSKQLRPQDVTVIEPVTVLRERAASLGVHCLSNGSDYAPDEAPRLIIIAVKPQVMSEVLPSYQRFQEYSTFVSVAAGIQVALLSKHLGDKAAIVRCMPNTPAAIGKGMMVTYSNPLVSADNWAFIDALLHTSGKVAQIHDESLMDAVTAVSGSGPAYIFHFIECLTDAGISAGLPAETASILAMQTVYGSGALAAESDESPSQLRINVTSPNGTTAAALEVLMGNNRLKNLLTDAVEAARLRAVELGK